MDAPSAAPSGFERVLPGDGIVLGREALEAYARDSWPRALWWGCAEIESHSPSAAARPKTTEEVQAVLRYCAGHSLPVVARGGGSGVLGAAIPSRRGSVILDLSSMGEGPEVLDRDGEDDIVRAQAGVFGDVLENRLNERGLSCVHFPASMAVSTIGGWVATDGWGQCSTAYGPFRDHLVSLECVLPDGQILQDAAPGEWVGTEGALGVITRVTFRAARLPGERAFAAFEFPGMSRGFDAVRAIYEADLKTAVVRLYDGLDRKLLGPEKESVSDKGGLGDLFKARLLRLRGRLRTLADLPGIREAFKPLLVIVAEGSSARDDAARAEEIALRRGARSLGESPARKWWEHRYRLSFEKIEGYRRLGCFADTLDVVAPWGRMEKVYTAMIAAAKPHGVAMAHASHLHDKGVCLYFTLSGAGGADENTLRLYGNCWRAMIEACIDAGGCPDHHHGVGLAKAPWITSIKNKDRLEALRSSKRRLDPQNLMNPDKWM